MEKQCSKCYTAFGCKTESRGCWCESLQVPIDTLVQLKEQFDNCLCPSCLRQYAVDSVDDSVLREQAGGH